MPDKKPTYKERNGTSRVGDFLRSIGKSKVLSKVLDVSGEIVTGDFGGAIEKIISNTSEMQQSEKDFALKLLQQDIEENAEISNRWKYDMQSDSWLSKNIRPLVLAYLVFCTTIYIILDSSIPDFTVQEHWVTLLTGILITTITAYFGGRSFEKIKK